MTAQNEQVIENVHSDTQSHIDQNVEIQAGHYIFTVVIFPGFSFKRTGEILTLFWKIYEYKENNLSARRRFYAAALYFGIHPI